MLTYMFEWECGSKSGFDVGIFSNTSVVLPKKTTVIVSVTQNVFGNNGTFHVSSQFYYPETSFYQKRN